MKFALIAGAALFVASAALAQTPATPAPVAPPAAAPQSMGDRDFHDVRMGLGVQGELVFNRTCSLCHKPDGQDGVDDRAPHQETLRQYPPERILGALTDGKMKAQGARLTDTERRQVSEWLSGRSLSGAAGGAETMTNRCKSDQPTLALKGDWNGWSASGDNARYQDAKAAGLTAADLPRLKLKWAFGLPGGVETSSQPTVVGGTVYVGSDGGEVYAIDAGSSCVHWSYLAGAGIRTAPVVFPIGGRHAVVVGDLKANLYAIDTRTGALIWKTTVDDQTLARITAAPTYAAGRLYAGVSSSEEISGMQANYECCRMRGVVASLDAATGKVLWKFYTIADKAAVVGKKPDGRAKWGPAGVGVWGAPTVDPVRGLLYVATGDSFTAPAQPLSDSVLALELKTGKLVWSYQATANDAYMTGCDRSGPNCPATNGPDFDFASSAVLQTLPGGKQIIVAGHKGGVVLALDPDAKGKLLWQVKPGPKPSQAKGEIVFGGAADGRAGYYALHVNQAISAVDLTSGKVLWLHQIDPPADRPKRLGSPAAVTAMPGVVFNGGWDGVLRAFSATDGAELWSYDTAKAFDTVNGVAGKGGSMGAPGATVAGGMLFVGSGYIGTANGMPGNVILAFGKD